EKAGRFPENPLWVHAVSVGEVQSAWPLLDLLARENPAESVLLSTTTATGRETAFRLADGLFGEHIYYPWDVPRIVRRSLDRIRPKGYIVMETEIWPAMLLELKKRSIPAFLANGRFSERTARNVRKRPAFWRQVYGLFSLLLVRSAADRDVLADLGVPGKKIRVTGDCKVDALLLRKQATDLSRVRRIAGGKAPVFVAGSTHRGEVEIVLRAFRIVRERVEGARLILVPRHPERSREVLDLASGTAGATLLSAVEQRESAGSEPWEILVADKIGVLFDLYGVSDGAFIGGSLVDKGGQNIMEPAAFGIPFSHGPFMRDFVEAAGELGKLGAATLVRTDAEMAAHWERCLEKNEREKARLASGAYIQAVGGAAKTTLDEIRREMTKNDHQ
ncbi:MAG: 3-deoxy-D-manno-octulosonic acid transferase, partial [Aminobacteriaceae bacterium]